jgi:cation diffusion facilitator family transporter
VASWPADRNHPYGHGKVEFMTAAFEGGLIAFAALLIIYEAIGVLIRGAVVESLDVGIGLTFAAGVANYVLGWFLIHTGERNSSAALIADGKHVQADFWTSVGVVAGLGLVIATGLTWLDPVIAILVGINLAFTGWRLVRESAGALLDEEDPALLRELVAAINANRIPGVIRLHYLRAIRSGNFRHVDAHLVVPEFWPVERAHDLADELEARVASSVKGEAEIAFHLDPCKRSFCRECDLPDCPIRVAPFVAHSDIPFEEAVRPEPRDFGD